MFPPRWTCSLAALLCVLTTAVSGATESERIQARKQAVLRSGLEGQGRVVEATLLEAATRADALLRIDVAADSGKTIIGLTTTGAPQYRTLSIPTEKKFVIDLYDTVNLCASQVDYASPSESTLLRVRSSLFALEPRLVSRVVLDLARQVKLQIAQQPGFIEISFRDQARKSAPTKTEPTPRATDLLLSQLDVAIQQLQDQAPHAPAPSASLRSPTWSGWTQTYCAVHRTANWAQRALVEGARNLVRLQQAHELQLNAKREANRAYGVSLLRAARAADMSSADRIGALAMDLQAVQAMQFDFARGPATPVAALAENSESAAQPVPDTNASAPEAATTDSPEATSKTASGGSALAKVKNLLQNLTEAQPDAPAATEMAAAEPAEAPAPATPEAGGTAEITQTPVPPGTDPLEQIVDIDFRDMDLINAVGILAEMGQVSVIAGTEVKGKVTVDFRGVPLRRALESVLKINGLGLVEEDGIFRIVPFEEALMANRVTRMVVLKEGDVAEIKQTLDAVIVNSPQARSISIAANESTNTLVLSGPGPVIQDLEDLASQLDFAEPKLPTVTEALKLNYAEPQDVLPIIKNILSPEIGKVSPDERGRHLIVTDIPVVVEQARLLVQEVDMPVKQVSIDTMIVDALMRDATQTGTSWVLSAVRHLNTRGQIIGDLQNLSFSTPVGAIGSSELNQGTITLGVLTDDIDLRATIAAEVASRNAEILANPVVVTMENKEASIEIVQEFPFTELKQGLTGPPVSQTSFKPIGVTLAVTPRVTHDNDVLVDITAKQSSISGITETGVPIEDKREATTSLRTMDGQTIFIGGLRNISDRLEANKVPILGDVPILNFMFRHTSNEKVHTELLTFLTCRVVQEHLPELTPKQQLEFDKMGAVPDVPDSQRTVLRTYRKPGEMRDTFWKWRRAR
ncbi:MAG: hypothetical protein HY706_04955 [Candidatus Hydrogenedentes bacterium]|nr:hypothetical protein [Candidatus Hydrogenedentota bacterium]